MIVADRHVFGKSIRLSVDGVSRLQVTHLGESITLFPVAAREFLEQWREQYPKAFQRMLDNERWGEFLTTINFNR